jgi:S1-C subfamily serine protease
VGIGVLAVAVILGVLLVAGSGGDDSDTVSAADIVKDNRTAVVSINTKGPAFDEEFNKVTVQGGGTGIVVNASKAWVLTNDHVVSGASSVKARLANGEEVNARVVGHAPCEDLAVIQLTPRPRGLTATKLGQSRGAAPGDEVTALGFPGAFEADITQRKLQSTEGTVSSKPSSATLGASLPTLPSVIQHQAPISPGNSGGPLFDDQGEVIGINTVSGSSESGRQNQNGAIAIDRARSLLPDLQRGRHSGYVGWSLEDVDGALYVSGVDANSPADREGMLLGDRIDELDGTVVGSVPDACDILASKSEADSVKVAGQQLDERVYTVTIGLK